MHRFISSPHIFDNTIRAEQHHFQYKVCQRTRATSCKTSKKSCYCRTRLEFWNVRTYKTLFNFIYSHPRLFGNKVKRGDMRHGQNQGCWVGPSLQFWSNYVRVRSFLSQSLRVFLLSRVLSVFKLLRVAMKWYFAFQKKGMDGGGYEVCEPKYKREPSVPPPPPVRWDPGMCEQSRMNIHNTSPPNVRSQKCCFRGAIFWRNALPVSDS